MGLGDKVRKLDIFKKVPTDLSEGTNRGGFLSLLALISIVYFLIVEIQDYLSPQYNAMIVPDKLVTRKEMKIHLDIVLPHFPCEIISLDIQDAMMSHSPNLGSVHKYRLDRQSQPIDGGSTDFQLLRQSNQERQYQIAKQAFQNKYGCRLRGDFTVKQVPGNFHISSHAYQNIYARLRMQGVINTLDMSHRVNYLFFGDLDNISAIQKQHPEAVLSKLNGHVKTYDMQGTPHAYISHYHLDIVPTIYRNGWFSTEAYQYTYNHNTFEVSHMPSLYFNYQIGGLVVEVQPQSDELSTFLIKLCAIIGGTYAIALFIDNALDSIINDKYKQYQLIK